MVVEFTHSQGEPGAPSTATQPRSRSHGPLSIPVRGRGLAGCPPRAPQPQLPRPVGVHPYWAGVREGCKLQDPASAWLGIFMADGLKAIYVCVYCFVLVGFLLFHLRIKVLDWN